MPKRLTISKKKLLDSLVAGFTITHEINTSYQWEDRKNIHKLCEIFNEKNDQYLIEKFMQGFEGKIGDDVYFTLVLATKLLTKIIFPHIKKIVGEKEEK